ncbi:hypothetical protein ACERIT_01650 [Halopenitus sp. H-Gu1]|uniref:hypothetical protein n=1 Tax=Halopenitus sp. H-Gu1 TaxID=3242697 RepID=UPI00359D2B20
MTGPTSVVPLDFHSNRDSGSASWEHADPTAALIERVAWNHWRVTLPGSENTYEVRLEHDHGAFVGKCEVLDGDDRKQCPARKYNNPDEPCAHLCTIRKAAFVEISDVQGEPVTVFETDDVAAQVVRTPCRDRVVCGMDAPSLVSTTRQGHREGNGNDTAPGLVFVECQRAA